MNLETSLAQLKKSLDPLLPIFLLIDPMVGEPMTMNSDTPPVDLIGVMAARQATWQRDIVKIVLPASIDLSAHLQPYLVMLHGLDDVWLQASLEIALGENNASQERGLAGAGGAIHRIGGWLQTSASIDAFSKQISALAKLQANVPTNARYLRVADRRTLSLLRWVVGDGQIANCLSLLNRWVYLDALSNISMLKYKTLQEAKVNKSQIIFSIDQWASFVQASALHTTMARWFGQSKLENKPILQKQLNEIYQSIDQVLKQAKTIAREWPHYFKSEVDQYAWAVLVLAYPSLAKNKYIQQWLENESASQSDDPPSNETMNIICHRLLADYRKQTP
jgi:hypothetical protein